MKLKSIILLVPILFYSSTTFCQDKYNEWHKNDTITASIKSDTTLILQEIKDAGFHIEEYSFSTQLANYYIDSTNNGIILVFKSKNRYKDFELIYFDYINSKVVWSHFSSKPQLRIFNDYITAKIYSPASDKCIQTLLSLKSGEIIKVLEDNVELQKLDSADAFISFPSCGRKESIKFLNSNTFEVMGQQRIKDVYYLNALKETRNNVKLNINGIFSFDSTYNLQWFYPINNRHESLSSVLEYFYIPYFRHLNSLNRMPIGCVPNYDIYIGSEFIEHDSTILVSGIEFIDRINARTGERVWQNTFPKKQGFSVIHLKNDTVIHIGMALSLRDGHLYYFKKPSITLLDYNTGEILKFLNFEDSKYIIDYELIGNELTILLNNKMAKYNITDLENEKVIFTVNEESDVFLGYLPENDTSDYFLSDSLKVVPVSSIIKNSLSVFTKDGLIYYKNDSIQVLPTKSIYSELHNSDHKYLYKTTDNKLFIAQLNKQLEVENHFFIQSNHYYFFNNKLLIFWNDKFATIDLD